MSRKLDSLQATARRREDQRHVEPRRERIERGYQHHVGRESWATTLIEGLSLESALMRAGAQRVVADGRVIHVPRILVAPAADWVGELVELPSDAGSADTLELTPKKVGNVVSLSRESIEDSAVGELDAVGRAMVRGVAVKVDAKFFSDDAATGDVAGRHHGRHAASGAWS